NLILVGLSLSGLSLAGLGIDSLRESLDPNAPRIVWPLGGTPSDDWSPMERIGLITVFVFVVSLVLAGLKFVTAVASASLSQKIVIQLRTDVYDKLQRLSFHYFDSHDSSSLINRVAGDVQAVRGFVDGVILKVLTVTLSLTVYLVYMLSVHATLALVCLITSPILWVGAVLFSRTVRPLYKRSSELGDKLILRLSENILGIQVVKGFAREEDEIRRFQGANRLLKDQKDDIFWKLSLYQPVMGLLTQVSQCTVIGYGGWLVIRGELPLGTGLFVFANLIHEFANQVGQIINIANSIQTSLTGAERVFEVLDSPIEIQSRPGAVQIERLAGSVEFENVSFSYEPGKPVLQEICFKIAPGECIGIVGETGSGKTTLLNLISRFYDV
ncbi:MAG: ABC transporter ATP-binding protein, partial [Planctomycetes bacterium]|nr:ABC transporter ATP-binding protein [Planctomycetota bacterium]